MNREELARFLEAAKVDRFTDYLDTESTTAGEALEKKLQWADDNAEGNPEADFLLSNRAALRMLVIEEQQDLVADDAWVESIDANDGWGHVAPIVGQRERLSMADEPIDLSVDDDAMGDEPDATEEHTPEPTADSVERAAIESALTPLLQDRPGDPRLFVGPAESQEATPAPLERLVSAPREIRPNTPSYVNANEVTERSTSVVHETEYTRSNRRLAPTPPPVGRRPLQRDILDDLRKSATRETGESSRGSRRFLLLVALLTVLGVGAGVAWLLVDPHKVENGSSYVATGSEPVPVDVVPSSTPEPATTEEPDVTEEPADADADADADAVTAADEKPAAPPRRPAIPAKQTRFVPMSSNPKPSAPSPAADDATADVDADTDADADADAAADADDAEAAGPAIGTWTGTCGERRCAMVVQSGPEDSLTARLEVFYDSGTAVVQLTGTANADAATLRLGSENGAVLSGGLKDNLITGSSKLSSLGDTSPWSMSKRK